MCDIHTFVKEYTYLERAMCNRGAEMTTLNIDYNI
jgi:hypothetical protein